MKNNKKVLFATLFILIATLSIFSCKKTEKAVAVESVAVTTSSESVTPKVEGTIKVVATSESYKKIFDKFTAETGVKTELLSMSSGEMLSKLRSEGGRPAADLWFGGGIDAFMNAKNDGLLEKVDIKDWDRISSQFKDEDGYWLSKGLTIVGFIANNRLLEEKNLPVPRTWDDLLNEGYKGEIIMSNPAISGTNYAALNALLQKKGDQGWDYFERLNNNIAYYSRRGSDPKNRVIADEFAVGITYLDGTIDALLKDYDVTIVYPSDGLPWIPDGVAVLKNSSNLEGAKFFVDWLFSNDDNLRLLAEIDQKTSVKVIKPSISGIELGYDTSILMKEDLSLFGKERTAILDKFNEVAQGKTT